jgi:hypothetical protein
VRLPSTLLSNLDTNATKKVGAAPANSMPSMQIHNVPSPYQAMHAADQIRCCPLIHRLDVEGNSLVGELFGLAVSLLFLPMRQLRVFSSSWHPASLCPLVRQAVSQSTVLPPMRLSGGLSRSGLGGVHLPPVTRHSEFKPCR